MWHVSGSFQTRGRMVPQDQWPAPVRRAVERELKRLLDGVGDGPRRWEKGSAGHGHVLHVRRSLSEAELAELTEGPPATSRGGDFGGLYYCKFVAR